MNQVSRKFRAIICTKYYVIIEYITFHNAFHSIYKVLNYIDKKKWGEKKVY